MKPKQYFFIVLIIAVGICLVFLLRRSKFKKNLFKNQMIIEVIDTSYNKYFPEKVYVLSSLNFYQYIKHDISSFMINAKYVGSLYDYQIQVFFKNSIKFGKFQYINEKLIDSVKITLTYRTSYSVFYEKAMPPLKVKSGKMIVFQNDSLYHLVGNFFLLSNLFNCKIFFRKDSLPMYNFKIL
jgi:hypothetical protein